MSAGLSRQSHLIKGPFLIPEEGKEGICENVRIFQIGGRKVKPEVALAQISKHRLSLSPKRKPLLPALKAQGPRPVNAVRYNLLWQLQPLSDSAAWKRLQHASITNTLSSFISISCCAGRLAAFLPWISELSERTGWNCGTEIWRTNHRVSHPHSVSLNTLNTHQNNPAHALVGEHTVWWSGGPSSCRLDAFRFHLCGRRCSPLTFCGT